MKKKTSFRTGGACCGSGCAGRNASSLDSGPELALVQAIHADRVLPEDLALHGLGKIVALQESFDFLRELLFQLMGVIRGAEEGLLRLPLERFRQSYLLQLAVDEDAAAFEVLAGTLFQLGGLGTAAAILHVEPLGQIRHPAGAGLAVGYLETGEGVEDPLEHHARELDHLADRMGQRPHLDQLLEALEAEIVGRRAVDREQSVALLGRLEDRPEVAGAVGPRRTDRR